MRCDPKGIPTAFAIGLACTTTLLRTLASFSSINCHELPNGSATSAASRKPRPTLSTRTVIYSIRAIRANSRRMQDIYIYIYICDIMHLYIERGREGERGRERERETKLDECNKFELSYISCNNKS